MKIGVLEPISGPNASAGPDMRNGAQLAADIVNGVYPDLEQPRVGNNGLPALGGADVELVVADTQGDPETAAREAERLVTEEGVVALTGAYESAVTQAASEVAERLRIPFVNGDSTAPSLTERGLHYFFRTGPTDVDYGRTFFSLIDDRRAAGVPISTVGILHIDNEFGREGATATTELARKHGLTVTADAGYDADSEDLVPAVRQIQEKEPDVLFVLAYAPDALLMQEAFARLGYLPPMVIGYGAGFSEPDFVDGPVRAARAQGYLRRAAWSADLAARYPTARKVARAFEERFGASMTENSARTFTAVTTLAVAVNEAGSTDPERVRSALRGLDLEGRDLLAMPWDHVRFDANGQNTGARTFAEQFLGDRWRLVYPNDVRAEQVVWPLYAARELQGGGVRR
ncbi:ABC transporter substrate-binding protein [Streptomyces shenzhenensis]|uniref:ABC transporter substrate-binding protein n=1 Tax=Streptomyces shenzhenensis TaxID=943815 RepID=UPI0015F06E70|nr:ABC transporter substrate-binding protein [Streptomyces shenzhenensis]